MYFIFVISNVMIFLEFTAQVHCYIFERLYYQCFIDLMTSSICAIL